MWFIIDSARRYVEENVSINNPNMYHGMWHVQDMLTRLDDWVTSESDIPIYTNIRYMHHYLIMVLAIMFHDIYHLNKNDLINCHKSVHEFEMYIRSVLSDKNKPSDRIISEVITAIKSTEMDIAINKPKSVFANNYYAQLLHDLDWFSVHEYISFMMSYDRLQNEACKFHEYTPEQFAQERLKFVIDTHNRSCNCESPFFTTVAESRIGTFDHVSSIHHFCLEKVLQYRVIVN